MLKSILTPIIRELILSLIPLIAEKVMDRLKEDKANG